MAALVLENWEGWGDAPELTPRLSESEVLTVASLAESTYLGAAGVTGGRDPSLYHSFAEAMQAYVDGEKPGSPPPVEIIGVEESDWGLAPEASPLSLAGLVQNKDEEPETVASFVQGTDKDPGAPEAAALGAVQSEQPMPDLADDVGQIRLAQLATEREVGRIAAAANGPADGSVALEGNALGPEDNVDYEDPEEVPDMLAEGDFDPGKDYIELGSDTFVAEFF